MKITKKMNFVSFISFNWSHSEPRPSSGCLSRIMKLSNPNQSLDPLLADDEPFECERQVSDVTDAAAKLRDIALNEDRKVSRYLAAMTELRLQIEHARELLDENRAA